MPTDLQGFRELFEKAFPNHDFNWKDYPNRIVGLCPFHEDTHPSFNIFVAPDGTLAFKCFACGKSGTLHSFLKEFSQNLQVNYQVVEREKEEQGGKERELQRKIAQKVNHFVSIAEEEFKKLTNQVELGNSLTSKEENEYRSLLLAEGIRISEEEILTAFIRLFAKKNGIYLYDDPVERLKYAADYFHCGVITEKTLEVLREDKEVWNELERKYRLSEKIGWAVFPYYTLTGWLTGIKIRNIATSSRSSRMLNLYTKRVPSFFGAEGYLREAVKKDNLGATILGIMEGETDAVSYYANSFLPAVAVGSASNYPLILEEEFPFTIPIIFPDYDKFTFRNVGAGRKAVIDLYYKWKKQKQKQNIYVFCEKDGYGTKGYEEIEPLKDVNESICAGFSVQDLLNKKIEKIGEATKEFKKQHEEFQNIWFIRKREKLKERGLEGVARIFAKEINLQEGVALSMRDIPLETERVERLLGKYPPNKISFIAGTGGTGKTSYAIYISCRTIAEMVRRREHKKVLIWTTEHEPSEVKRVLMSVAETYFARYTEEILDNVYCQANSPVPAYNSLGEFNERAISQIEKTLRDYDIVFLDPFLVFYGGDENKSHLIRQYLERINGVLRKLHQEGLTRYLIFLAHTSKSRGKNDVNIYTNDYVRIQENSIFGAYKIRFLDNKISKLTFYSDLVRGSSDIKNAARYVEMITTAVPSDERGTAERIVVCVKKNYPAGGSIGEGFIIPDLYENLKKKEEKENIVEEGSYISNDNFDDDDIYDYYDG